MPCFGSIPAGIYVCAVPLARFVLRLSNILLVRGMEASACNTLAYRGCAHGRPAAASWSTAHHSVLQSFCSAAHPYLRLAVPADLSRFCKRKILLHVKR
jgi:hypothetical protein